MSALHPDIAAVLEGRARWCVVEGDCFDVLRAMPDRSVDHCLSDPPFSEHVHSVGAVQKKAEAESFGFDALSTWDAACAADDLARICRRWVVLFCDFEDSAPLWRRELGRNRLDVVRTGLWVKPDAMPQLTGDRPGQGAEALVIAHPKGRKRWNSGGKAGVWTHCIERKDRKHPTQKPLPLMLELIADFTDEDEVILDPFAGSGSTGVAAVRMGRRCILIEKNAEHAAIARERLAAESQGLTLRDARAGQLSLLGGA